MNRTMQGLVMAAAAWLALSSTTAMADNCGDRPAIGRGDRLVVFALTSDQRLVRFRECSPDKAKDVGTVSGLAGDTALIGIDFRVQDGLLYGVGNAGGIYTVDTGSGAASKVSQLTVALDPNATSFGVDFNPAANALRIISDMGQNLRHPFAGALMFMTQTDGSLDYPAAGLDTPGPTATGVSGAAYTNNDLDPNTGTTLIDLDANLNQISIQSPPNDGSLVTTGKLIVDPDAPVGLDVYTDLRGDVAVGNRAFASLVVAGISGFYRVNPLTGAAVLIDGFEDEVIDIAIPLDQ